MKRNNFHQQKLTFIKKPRTSDDDVVCEKTSFLPRPEVEEKNNIVSSVDISNCESEATNKYDIGNYIDSGKNLSNDEKLSILNDVWVPNEKYSFPVQDCGKFKRRFQLKWLENFKWLAYSQLKEGAFCKYCVLFLETDYVGKGGRHASVCNLVKKPSTDLKKALEMFSNHGKAAYHKACVAAAENIRAISLNKNNDILMQLDTQRKQDSLKNRQKLASIVQTIRLCGRQNLPLRGHEDSGRILLQEPENNDGNFRTLLRLRALNGDDILKEHLLNSGGNAMYTSPSIQNELIHIFGELMQSQIVKKISKSEFFSIIADETTDIAQVEQLSLCVRYVDEEIVKIREDFISFIPVKDVTGTGLTATILESLKKLGFDLNKLRGQGYDGAATMRGQFRGVQALIKEKYPKALYTHCVSHSLNLCLSDATKIQGIRNAFGVISEICAFFHKSAKRTTILENRIKELKPETKKIKLKTFCETRWVLRHEAILLFKDFIAPVIASLEEIESLPSSDSSKKAHILLQSVCQFQFLISLCIISKLLSYTYNLSEYLQSSSIDLANAVNKVADIIAVLQGMRENNEVIFTSIYNDAKSLAESENIDVTKPRVCKIQKNRANTPHKTTEEYYRLTLFLPYVDDLICSLKERFLSHGETISALKNIIPEYAVKKDFLDIQPSISFYEDDLSIYSDVIKSEWELWKMKWMSSEVLPSSAIDSLYECDKNIFPNIHVLLKILAVLPVSTASAERSFSTLRRLKTYLRSTTSENRLTGLALLNIHRQYTISDDMVIDKFASSGTARKYNFIL